MPKKNTVIRKRNQQKPLQDVQYGDRFQPIEVDLIQKNKASHSGTQTQKKQTAQASSSVFTPLVIRRPQTRQASATANTPFVMRKPQTRQASATANTPFVMRKPQTAQFGMTTQKPPAKTLDNISVSVPFLSRGASPVENAYAQTQRKQTAQASASVNTPFVMRKPQTAQMGMQARPQVAQMGMQARPQVAQMGMQARPQVAQMGMQTQVQQKPAMVSMGTMMVQQPEQAKPQPTIMESIGSLFGYNNQQQEEEFVYYGYERDPSYYRNTLNQYGVTYLRSFAKQYGFKGYSTANKKELVKMLTAFFAGRQEMTYKNRNCLGMKELKSDYTLQELRKAASKAGLKNYSNISKNELCRVLHRYDKINNQTTEKMRKLLNKIHEKKKLSLKSY